jgi:hypothetical protein
VLPALVADNLDLGRPDQVKLIFGRRIRSRDSGSRGRLTPTTPSPPTPGRNRAGQRDN